MKRKPTKNNTSKTSISLPAEVMSAALVRSKAESRNFSSYVCSLIVRDIKATQEAV